MDEQVTTTVLRSKMNLPAAQSTRTASAGQLGPGIGIMLLPSGEAMPPLGSSSYSRRETGLSQSLSSMPHQVRIPLSGGLLALAILVVASRSSCVARWRLF